MPKPGERRPFRPQPKDFVDVYLREGLNGCCLFFCAHKRNVQAWIEANGGMELVDRRLRYLASEGRRATVNRDLAQRIRRARRVVQSAMVEVV